jgi:hypothetical protein
MKPKELLNKYIDKKNEYLNLLSQLGILEVSENVDMVHYYEIESRTAEAEKEMLGIARMFIESFIY